MEPVTIFVALDGERYREVGESIIKYVANTGTLNTTNVRVGFKIETGNVLNDPGWMMLVVRMKHAGFPVFLDLKLANGPDVIRQVIKQAAEFEIDVLTVSATLGSQVLSNIVRYSQKINGPQIAVLGPLTFLDDHAAREIYGCDYESAVLRAAEIARDSESWCMIVPPNCISLEWLPEWGARKICPGIRRKKDAANGQVQFTSPEEAIQYGATDLVIGSPIYKADHPIDDLKQFIRLTDQTVRQRLYNEYKEIARLLFKGGAVSIRENPFVYSSGNRGPGYVDVKGMIGHKNVYLELCRLLARKVARIDNRFDFVESNVTGGIIPGWEIAQYLRLPFIYMRKDVKVEGKQELFTGITDSIQPGMRTIVVEELVNYAKTTVAAVEALRKAGYIVDTAATILSYNHEEQQERLQAAGIKLIALIDLPQMLDIFLKEKWLTEEVIKSYQSYLQDPISWQIDRGYYLPKASINTAIEMGYMVTEVTTAEAVENGIPEAKVIEVGPYYRASLSE